MNKSEVNLAKKIKAVPLPLVKLSISKLFWDPIVILRSTLGQIHKEESAKSLNVDVCVGINESGIYWSNSILGKYVLPP